MDIIEFFRREQKRLHAELRHAVGDLTTEEWNVVPEGTANSIAFIFWHCVRTEDNILRFILQERRSPIWNEGQWSERLGLPPRVQGTGMAGEEARSLRINDPALFMQYAEEVWREYEEYLAGITDGGAELSARMVTVRPLGEMPAILTIGQVCISHLFTHVGEMAAIRGTLGKKGLVF